MERKTLYGPVYAFSELEMARLAEIETSYYTATKAAKLSEREDSDVRFLPKSLYVKETFEQWTRTIDIYDLEKFQADFSLDEEIVDAFGKYRHKVASELSKSFQYDKTKFKSQVRNIGSCHDGSKVGRMNEVDSLFILEGDNIIVEESDRDGFYRIFLKQGREKCEILPQTIRKQFADAYEKVISRLPLPDCLRHGGYISPRYSGLRYNRPAATSQFLTKENYLLTWDMTPTFCLPGDHTKDDEVNKIIKPIIKVIKEKMLDIYIHLIPDAGENLWRLSTAQLEADILRILPSVTPIKQALSYCKVLCSKLKKWNAQNGTRLSLQDEQCDLDVVKELYECCKELDPNSKTIEGLNQKMRYCHVWIPPEKQNQLNEDEKGFISINTAAVKHILLSFALEQQEAFSAEKCTELVIKLMKMVFDTLGNISQFSSPHAFLRGASIQHFSVLASQAARNTDLALNTKEQCRTLVSNAMTMVGEGNNCVFTIYLPPSIAIDFEYNLGTSTNITW